jgi:type II secretory pathway component PulJ
MSLLACLTALTLSTILLLPPAWLIHRVLIHQSQIETRFLQQQNVDRSLELISRAIQGAGYQARTPQYRATVESIKIQKGSSSRSGDAIMLTQDIPDPLGYDCMGNALTRERTIKQQAYQKFYLEPNRHDSRTQKLMCQSVDRQGRLHQGEILNNVLSLQIDWVRANSLTHQPEISRTSTGLIAITLRVQPQADQNDPARVIEQTRYISQRHGMYNP